MVSSLKREPTVTIIMRAWASRPNLQKNHSIKKPKQEMEESTEEPPEPLLVPGWDNLEEEDEDASK